MSGGVRLLGRFVHVLACTSLNVGVCLRLVTTILQAFC